MENYCESLSDLLSVDDQLYTPSHIRRSRLPACLTSQLTYSLENLPSASVLEPERNEMLTSCGATVQL